MTKSATNKIPAEVLTVLTNCRIEGNKLYLPGQLDRKLYDATMKVLDILGAEWKRGLKCHVFGGLPADGTEAVELVEAACTTGEYVDAKKLFQAFYTPTAFADELVQLVPMFQLATAGTRILEPSAGEGALLSALHRVRHPLIGARAREDYTAVELNPKCVPTLAANGFAAVTADFLAWTAPAFDLVLANPPFTKNQDAQHVARMLDLLKPTGTLIAVVAGSFPDREAKVAEEVRRRLAALDAMVLDNPPSSFAASGTEVRTVTIAVNADIRGPWLRRNPRPI